MTPGRPAALVTGGARRVGGEICRALARAGWDLAIHHRGGGREAEALVREIVGAGGRALALAADLDDASAPGRLLEAAASRLGPLSLLVNNASRFEAGEFESFTAEGLLDHMRPNLIAPLLLSQAFAAAAKDLAPSADPSIVNVLDQRVLRPNPLFFSYTLSKAALWTATQTLAQALAPRIRVNAVGPGPTLPSVHQEPGEFEREAAGVLLERPSAPGDVAAAVVYLAGARSVTGQLIAVDCGQHLGWRTPDVTA